MTEKFSSAMYMDRGAEQLVEILNYHISAIVEKVLIFGGDILKFAGDALLALWRVERKQLKNIITVVIKCSLEIHGLFETQEWEEGLDIRVKIGLAAGHISMLVFGDETHSHFLVIGQAVDDVRLAQNMAQMNDVILSPNCWQLCDRSMIEIESVPDQRAVKIDNKQLQGYLSELRPVTIVFVNLMFEDQDKAEEIGLAIQDAYMHITSVLKIFQGQINKVFMFDKGCSFLCVFGFPGEKVPDELTHALECAMGIFDFCSQVHKIQTVSIGIASGIVFCGIVGHTVRHEYTVIGQKVNLAARMMMYYPGIVTCDSVTYNGSNLPAYFFKELPKKVMKGVADSGPLYQYWGRTEKVIIAISLNKISFHQTFYTIQMFMASVLGLDTCKHYKERQTNLRNKVMTLLDEKFYCLLNDIFHVQIVKEERIIFIIDEAQFVDSTSWRFMEKLIRTLPIFIIMSLCPFVNIPCAAASAVMKNRNTTYIVIGAVQPNDISNKICLDLNVSCISKELDSYLGEGSCGIPFYCEELLKNLEHHEVLVFQQTESEEKTNRTWNNLFKYSIKLTEKLNMVTLHSDKESEEVCHLTSGVRLKNLSPPTSLKDHGEEEQLRELENEVIECHRIRFCNPMMQKTAYELWLKDQRKAMHLKCARFLEEDAHRCDHCRGRDFIPYHHFTVNIRLNALDMDAIKKMAMSHGFKSLFQYGPDSACQENAEEGTEAPQPNLSLQLNLLVSPYPYREKQTLSLCESAGPREPTSRIIKAYLDYSLYHHLAGYQGVWFKYEVMAMEHIFNLPLKGEGIEIVAYVAETLVFNKLIMGHLDLAIELGSRALQMWALLQNPNRHYQSLCRLSRCLLLNSRYPQLIQVLGRLWELSVTQEHIFSKAFFYFVCLDILLYSGMPDFRNGTTFTNFPIELKIFCQEEP
ncbi:ADCY10 isoform 5 [Pan troglodytes]|uniref:ADCY10 isoform 5 n=1 Tax=Pan troglodytes TaxID=9598 RepID=A0A2J8LLW2_PANTR|nr:ADCY10 isoform 5 [Pan troglodytes]